MNKGLLGFMIAGILAIIGFLIYWFFFRKQNSSTDNVVGSLGATVGTTATNPISSQDTTTKAPDYTPFPVDKEFPAGEAGETASHTTILSTGFNPQPQEALTSGNALAQRSNNPGALFWDGSTNWQGMDKTNTKSGQVIYFESPDYGVRAQLMTLKNYSKKHGINTLNGVTTRYAPLGHGNNDPIAYAKTLAGYMGIQPTDNFNLDANRNLLAAVGYYIHRVEAGYFWVPRSKYIEWSTKV